MSKIQLGSTGIEIEKNGFGCLPIQRISKEEAAHLLRKALDGGMNYFDTARAYTDSEEKMGYAFAGIREKVVIATKSMAKTGAEMKKELETSLKNLGTEHRLYRHLSVPQPRLLPQARRGGRPVRRRPGGPGPGENPPHRHHQPPPCGGP